MCKPKDFASQINLSMENCWGIVRAVTDLCLKLEEGKYLLVKVRHPVTLSHTATSGSARASSLPLSMHCQIRQRPHLQFGLSKHCQIRQRPRLQFGLIQAA